jgi:exodeoxyribonuclease VII large subunit
MLRVLRRRNAGIDVVILPTQVQGDGAEERIARQIEAANRHSLGDVIIVGRGGGSLEDLLPFSSETVVRAIAASRIPVISAIGHETDFVLSDFAADVRAATPSAAAELVASSRAELMARVRGLGAYIGDDLRRRLAMLRLKLEGASSESMVHAVKAHVQRMAQRADDAREDLVREMRRGAQTARHRMELGSRELASCSPVAVLGRGYAVVTHGRTGIVLHSADQVVTGEDIGIRLARGALRAMVEESYAGKGE